jgi:hypothetical protein
LLGDGLELGGCYRDTVSVCGFDRFPSLDHREKPVINNTRSSFADTMVHYIKASQHRFILGGVMNHGDGRYV